MRNILFLLMLILVASSCRNKDLCDGGACIGEKVAVKVVVNWDDPADARAMRMNIFSQTDGVIDYGKDNISISGEKTIKLTSGASYLPYCYDYYSNVYFKDETILETFQAYCAEVSRMTYNTLATPVAGEKTIQDPDGDFFAHSWQRTFDVEYCNECDDFPTIHFYPENKLIRFTYRINKIVGAQYIDNARGAASGMAGVYYFYTDELTSERSTVMFDGAAIKAGDDNEGYIEGSFYTFGPVYPYNNRFTIEILSKDNKYYTAWWDVSEQIRESMENREAKLARDGYDILIENNGDIPEIVDPGDEPGGGFEIDVGDWDEIDIYL